MAYITTPRPRYVATEGKINTLPRGRYTKPEPVEKGKLTTLPRPRYVAPTVPNWTEVARQAAILAYT